MRNRRQPLQHFLREQLKIARDFNLPVLTHVRRSQDIVLKHARQKTVMEKTAWQESERKRLSYRTLTERAAIEQGKIDNKRDQKMMDDHAARRTKR